MIEIGSYIIVLLSYFPGLYYIFKYNEINRLPLVVFCFLGLFLFNALGSILVMYRHYPCLQGSILTPEYIGILVAQAVIFYLIAGPYVYFRRRLQEDVILRKTDTAFIFVIAPIIILLLVLYYQEVGTFLVVELISGKMNHSNLLEYRELTYGLTNFRYYRLGFLVLPSILAAHALLVCSARKRFTPWYLVVIFVCFIPTILLGEKSGILYLILVMIIAYSVKLSFKGNGLIDMVRLKYLFGIFAAFIPTIIIYQLYYSGLAKKFKISNLIYRILGVYSESIALSVKWVDQNGHLSGLTLPTIKGLLKHDRFNIETALHVYLSSLFGDFHSTTTQLQGNIPVSAIGEGYINFGWMGVVLFAGISFISVVFIQEILLRLRLGIISYTLMVWYAYLSLNISMYSIFYTFFSFIHTYVFVGVLALYYITFYIMKKLGIEQTEYAIRGNR